MKRISLIIVITGLLVLVVIFFAGMAHKAENNKNNEAVYVASNEKNAVNYSKGSQIYQEKCLACHQVNGTGIPGTFPPLKGSDFLKKSTKKRLIEQVMNGSNERLVVNGIKYTTPMSPQVDNATDAVAVVNYILNAWGNNYGVATLQDAKGIKTNKSNRHHMMMNNGMMRNMRGI